MFSRLTEAKGKGSPLAQTIERARVGMGRGSKLTQDVFNDVMRQFGFTPELFAQLPDEQQKEVIDTVREEVEKPAEEAPAEEAPAEEKPAEYEEDADGNAILDLGDVDEKVEDKKDDEDDDNDDIIQSNDSLESLNMAFTFLKYRHF